MNASLLKLVTVGTITYSISYAMVTVDEKTWLEEYGVLALGSLIGTLIFWLVFATNWRFHVSDLNFVTLVFLVWVSLGSIIFLWKTASFGKRFHSLLLALAPALSLVGFSFVDTQPSPLRWGIFDVWLILFLAGTAQYLLSKHTEISARFSWMSIRDWRLTVRWPQILVLLATLFFFFSGAYHIGRQAIVDEALWMYDRIPKFYTNLLSGDFDKTRVSDKPGVTVALISGVALSTYTPDKDFKNSYDPHAVDMYRAFRLPVLLAAALLLPLLFYFISRATTLAVGLLSIGLIATTPTLVGVSRIINPDALLWGLFSLAFFAYLAFLKERRSSYLVWSGIFFGLSLLTKYVSNFLIIYLLGFLPFLLTQVSTNYHQLRAELFNRLREIGIILLIGSLTLVVLYPATWSHPERILKATFLSEAYIAVAIPIALVLTLFFIDTLFIRSLFLRLSVHLMERFRSIIIGLIGFVFIGCIVLLLSSVWFGIPSISFADLLSSPKSSYRTTSWSTFYLANFYPLVFGMHPLVLLGALLAAVGLITRKIADLSHARATLATILFILTYYAGATASHVLSITRYQIVLYPLMAFLAALGWYFGFLWWQSRTPKLPKLSWPVLVTLLILFGVGTTIASHPHYMSYNSPLLPQTLITEYKDMGDGMYETAAYLNTLPSAESLTIYTDRAPLCRYFVGKCLRNFADINNRFKMTDKHFDYIVVTMNRSRYVNRFLTPHLREYNPRLIRYDRAYDFTNPDKTIVIGRRPSQAIKIIQADRISLINTPEP